MTAPLALSGGSRCAKAFTMPAVTLWLKLIPAALAVWKDENWNSQLDDWWHYKSGVIGGPDQWGRPAYMAYNTWHVCHRGRHQSPISVATARLVFDSNLGPLVFVGVKNPTKISVSNTGTDVQLALAPGYASVSGGPLSYNYSLFGALVKFGSDDKRGSEHRIDARAFPGELQFYGYNSDLYKNYSTALASLNGIVAVSAFLQVQATSTKDVAALIEATRKTILKGSRMEISGMIVKNLLPDTPEYVTYEGSLPFPGCHESVTWVILNRPIGITADQLKALRLLRISSVAKSAFMSNNWRPIQPVNRRSVRTNIRLKSRMQTEIDKCGIAAQQYFLIQWPED